MEFSLELAKNICQKILDLLCSQEKELVGKNSEEEKEMLKSVEDLIFRYRDFKNKLDNVEQ